MDLNSLIPILRKDYQELSRGELNVLRNAAREKYRFPGHVDAQTLFRSYLILKRRHVTALETVFIAPRRSTSSGVFGGISVRCDGVVVQAYDGIKWEGAGCFEIRSGEWFPLLTVFYFETETRIWCLSKEGHFFCVSSRNFSFEI